jgi:hypothetical protein
MKVASVALASIAASFIAAQPTCGGGHLGGGTGGGSETSITGAGGGCVGSLCSGGGPETGGSGGANAGGGANPDGSGSGGSDGAGPSGGGSDGRATRYPACSPDVRGDIDPRRMLLGADGLPVREALTAAVNVTAIDGAQITLTDLAGTRRWTWSPSIPDLPANRINVGNRFDLTVDAQSLPSSPGGLPCQTVVLAVSGTLVAFNSERATPACSSLPALDAWGVAVANAGPICEHPSTDARCDGFYFFATQVSVGNESTTVTPGQTTAFQGLSISLRELSGPTDYGCDGATAVASMAGFRAP